MYQQPTIENAKTVNNSTFSNANLAESTTKSSLEIKKVIREKNKSRTLQKRAIEKCQIIWQLCIHKNDFPQLRWDWNKNIFLI